MTRGYKDHVVPGYLDIDLLHDRENCDKGVDGGPCTRCTGFLPGNTWGVGVQHPGPPVKNGRNMSPLTLQPEAEEIAQRVRPHMPVWHPAFEGTLQSYCILLARIQRAHDALENAEKPDYDGPDIPIILGEDLRRWMNTSLKYAQQLGLTPASAAQILRDTTGGVSNVFRTPSQDELAQVPIGKLRELQKALTTALDPAAE